MIEFHLDGRSGVAPYLQLIHQVRQALRLGLLHEGDQLPKVKDVAAGLAINPNTVLKAYRELEYQGLAAAGLDDESIEALFVSTFRSAAEEDIAVIETGGLGKRYRRLWALSDCTLSVPAGHVVGLVGPNGAGKPVLWL